MTRKQKKAQRVKSRAYENALIKAAQTAEVKEFPYKTKIKFIDIDNMTALHPFVRNYEAKWRRGKEEGEEWIIYPELRDWLNVNVGEGNWLGRHEEGPYFTFYFKDELKWLLFKLSEWC